MSHNDFIELQNALLKKQVLKSGTKADIIKGSQVRPSKKKRLIGESRPTEPRLEPIKDETGELIGIKVYCTCGKATHVYFEYE